MSVGLKEVMGCPLSLLPLFQCGDGGALWEAKPAGSEAQHKKEEKTFFFLFLSLTFSSWSQNASLILTALFQCVLILFLLKGFFYFYFLLPT